MMRYYNVEDFDDSRGLAELAKKIKLAGGDIDDAVWDSDGKVVYFTSDSFNEEKFDELMTGSGYTLEEISMYDYFEHAGGSAKTYYRIEDFDNSRGLDEFMEKIESAGGDIDEAFWVFEEKIAYFKSESFDREKFDEAMSGSDYTVEEISKGEYFERLEHKRKRF